MRRSEKRRSARRGKPNKRSPLCGVQCGRPRCGILTHIVRLHLATLVEEYRRHGTQPAVVVHRGIRRQIFTYRDLANLSERFAAELMRRQITAGDRVVLWGENGAEWIAAFFGCVLRGVLVVPLDASGDAEFARRVIAETRPRLLVGDRALLARMPPVSTATCRASPLKILAPLYPCRPSMLPCRSRAWGRTRRCRFSSPREPPPNPKASSTLIATSSPVSSPSSARCSTTCATSASSILCAFCTPCRSAMSSGNSWDCGFRR